MSIFGAWSWPGRENVSVSAPNELPGVPELRDSSESDNTDKAFDRTLRGIAEVDVGKDEDNEERPGSSTGIGGRG